MITTNEAIEELSGIPEHRLTLRDAKRADAIQLGIEALKLYEENRRLGQYYLPKLLPGETED